ncbi:MAG: DNA-deoxyinosine glycosylase [Betaproteobacteria bacterium]|nr:DNA-deoxyinosine glycosylase [Betaproteobacteria bacterium]
MSDCESPQLTGLAPLLDERCRVLVLGSFPGAASLAAQVYYGHLQNQFWRILTDILPFPAGLVVTSSYQESSKCLLGQGVGLWDVYAACERQGSLDANIRHAQLNDLASLKQRCPQLQAIVHNGGESYKHRRHTEALGLPVHRLPSTSPANASVPYERKRQEWRVVLGMYLKLKPDLT